MGWKENMGAERAGMLAEARPREAGEWQQQARDALAANDFEMARMCYLKCVESWRQANRLNNEIYQREWEEATREYELFVEKDPIFNRLYAQVRPVVEANPGVLQTELYKKLPEIDRADMSYVLYFAAKQGKVVREKKGRTYQIVLPGMIVDPQDGVPRSTKSSSISSKKKVGVRVARKKRSPKRKKRKTQEEIYFEIFELALKPIIQKESEVHVAELCKRVQGDLKKGVVLDAIYFAATKGEVVQRSIDGGMTVRLPGVKPKDVF